MYPMLFVSARHRLIEIRSEKYTKQSHTNLTEIQQSQRIFSTCTTQIEGPIRNRKAWLITKENVTTFKLAPREAE